MPRIQISVLCRHRLDGSHSHGPATLPFLAARGASQCRIWTTMDASPEPAWKGRHPDGAERENGMPAGKKPTHQKKNCCVCVLRCTRSTRDVNQETVPVLRPCHRLSTATLGKGDPLVRSCTPANTTNRQLLLYPPTHSPCLVPSSTPHVHTYYATWSDKRTENGRGASQGAIMTSRTRGRRKKPKRHGPPCLSGLLGSLGFGTGLLPCLGSLLAGPHVQTTVGSSPSNRPNASSSTLILACSPSFPEYANTEQACPWSADFAISTDEPAPREPQDICS